MHQNKLVGCCETIDKQSQLLFVMDQERATHVQSVKQWQNVPFVFETHNHQLASH